MGGRIEMLEFIQCVLAKVLAQSDKLVQPCLINRTGFNSAVYQSDPALIFQQLKEIIQQALECTKTQLILIVSEQNKHLELEIYADDCEQVASKCTTPEKVFFSQAVCMPKSQIELQSLAKAQVILPSLARYSSLNLVHDDPDAVIRVLLVDCEQQDIHNTVRENIIELILDDITDEALTNGDRENTLFWPFYDTDIINMINNDTSKESLKVLVADDSMPSLIATKAMLEKLGCKVITANDGNAALAIAQQDSFDLLLLDERMPGLNGSDVAQILIEEDGTNRITPKVSLTGLTEPDEITHLFSKGITHYLEKPVTKLALEKMLIQWQV